MAESKIPAPKPAEKPVTEEPMPGAFVTRLKAWPKSVRPADQR